jgi:hypothetical protein
MEFPGSLCLGAETVSVWPGRKGKAGDAALLSGRFLAQNFPK